MLSKEEACRLLDSVYDEEMEEVHPCRGCTFLNLDPFYCLDIICADFDMNPSLHPEILLEPGPEQPRYRELFKSLNC